jgi:hypothetical protein
MALAALLQVAAGAAEPLLLLVVVEEVVKAAEVEVAEAPPELDDESMLVAPGGPLLPENLLSKIY